MPEKSIPEVKSSAAAPDNDPIVTNRWRLTTCRGNGPLMATLFWVLWTRTSDGSPWKTFQQEWKVRYATFLKTARFKSIDSQRG